MLPKYWKRDVLLQMATCNNVSVNLPDNNDKTVETTVMLNFTQQLFKYVGKGLLL